MLLIKLLTSIMKNLELIKIVILIFVLQINLFGQQERIVNWDFSSGVTGAISYRAGSAWNEFDFERNERSPDPSADNNFALHCRDNKEYVGKDNLGVGQYHGRAQSIIPCPEPGTSYTLSARGRIAQALNGEEPGEVALLFYDSNQNEIGSQILKYSNQTYQIKNKTFTIPANTVWATVWIRKKETVDFYMDWVSLKATVDDTPNAVTSFTASEVGATRVLLNWSPVPNATGYRIDRKKSTEGAGQWKTIFITHDLGVSTTFLDTRDSGFKALEPGFTYNYRIYALGDYGNAPKKNLNVTTASLTNSPGNTTYYVNAITGDDAADGKSKATAWRSFINIDKLRLAAGDKILLRRGHTWTEPLHIHGSGSAANNIIINAYQSGNDPKIVIDGSAHAAIQMIDVSHCTVKNVELSNYHPFFREMMKFGIRAGTWKTTTVSDLKFENIFINKIRGSAVRGGNLGSISGGELCAGIRVATDIRGISNVGNSIYDVSITNNNLLEVEHHAINLLDVYGVTISNNVIKRPGYISLLVRNINDGIIDNNYFIESGYYMTMADNAALDIYYSNDIIVEHNVVYKVYNDRSGQAINLDGCENFIVQYNLLKESASGCFVINTATNNIFRYNITEGFNDEWFRNLGGYNTQIYNNTIYAYNTNHAAQGFFIKNAESIETNDPSTNTIVKNNIFIRENSTEAENADLIYELSSTNGSVFSNNIYHGNFTDPVIEDQNPYFDDPELENPGNISFDINTLAYNTTGYQMKNSSAYLESGLVILNNGEFDFWGNELSPTEAPSIGAYQSAVALPIELIDFNAYKNSEHVEIEWQTAWEQNNLGFEVQHSTDGKSWSTISFEEGKGDSEQLNHYRYTHHNPNVGDNYYRLKQIDFDDHGTDDGNYSSMEHVYFEDESSLGIDVFPNPSSGIIHIRNSNNGLFNWTLLDPSGREIIQQTQLTKEQEIDLSMLPKGMYILHMETDTQSSNIRIALVD